MGESWNKQDNANCRSPVNFAPQHRDDSASIRSMQHTSASLCMLTLLPPAAGLLEWNSHLANERQNKSF